MWHADQPATALVISDHGDRAIAVARRGHAARLARLDLARRTAASWCEAQLACWAPDFDGQTWLVGQKSQLLVLDVLAEPTPELRPLDHRDLDQLLIFRISRSQAACVVHAAEPFTSGERWRWQLPAWILRRRGEAPRPWCDANQKYVSACSADLPSGEHVSCDYPATVSEPGGPTIIGGSPILSVFREDRPGAATRDVVGHPKRVAAAGKWIALTTMVDTCLEVHLIDLADLRTRLVVTLAGAADVALRFGDDTITLADDRGRILAVELRRLTTRKMRVF